MGRRRKGLTDVFFEEMSKTSEGRFILGWLLIISGGIGFIICLVNSPFFQEATFFVCLLPLGLVVAGIIIIVSEIRAKKEAERQKAIQAEQQRQAQIKEDRRQAVLKASNMAQIDIMKGSQFEEFLTLIFTDLGYKAENTPLSGDFGVDIILHKDGNMIIVQAKRYANKVSLPAVQEISTAKLYYHANEAWVVTNSYFTKSAKELAAANNIKLIDRDELGKLVISSQKDKNAS